ncbi:DUF3644 domain-containing protein [Ilumatobacter sp.]|uniref:DUF3644 domain-containing protein n=1 Tax=Ilumatobacter sp. TaxID=1967498 RepID=UPI003751C804
MESTGRDGGSPAPVREFLASQYRLESTPEQRGVTDGAASKDKALAESLLTRWNWGNGESKSELEREVWEDGSSHGRRFDRFIFRELGVNTKKTAKSTTQIEELERQVRSLGAHPVTRVASDWELHLAHSRKSMLTALRLWNDPTASSRTGAFSLLLVTAWNALALARLQRDSREWRKLDGGGEPVLVNGVPQAIDTRDAIDLAFPGDGSLGLRENLRLWIDLRNAVAHRYMPALDQSIIPEAQAVVLNYENVVVDTFGSEYALEENLSVPLQLSGFRDPGVLASRKKLLAALPLDVQALLSRTESELPELLSDPTYRLRIAFIPVAMASGNAADAVAYFVKPGEVPGELDEALSQVVVISKTLVDKCVHGGRKATKVIAAAIPFKLTEADHKKIGQTLGVRVADGKPDRTLKPEYAKYVGAAKIYTYSDGWIDLVIEELSDVNRFETLVGHSARPK